jgi:uncharacterized SAM-binding protein YcdF (DUF218 family)
MLTKVLTQLAMPLGTAALLALLGLAALALRRTSFAAALAFAGFAWVWLWATPVFSYWVRASLEARYPPVAIAALPAADAVVVLGGAISGAAPPRLYPDLDSAADRVWHAARLFHAGKAPQLILSGGALPWQRAQGPETTAMAAFLKDLGVPEGRLVLERGSTTTRENAVETKRLVDANGLRQVLLVTSALHMARAEASFRAVGIDVIPAATDHEILTAGSPTLLSYLPDASALSGSSRALKEYLGYWVYRLRGWATTAPHVD